MRNLGLTKNLLIAAAAAVIACCAAAAIAIAIGASDTGGPKASVALLAPAQVESGVEALLRGKTAGTQTSGRVAVQVREARKWRTLVAGRVRNRRFSFSYTFPREGSVSLRAVLGSITKPDAISATRHVSIVAAPAPVAAPSPSPAPAPTSSPPPAEAPAPPPAEASYWGAWIGPQLTGTAAPEDMNAVSAFEALARKPLSLLETYSPWAICPSSSCAPNQPFPAATLEKMRAYGAVPMYSWASEFNGSPDEPDYQLADIIGGAYDGYIQQWAEEAKAWGHPFFLRFDWEMNGTWFPWAEGANGNNPGEFVAAWQHVHSIFSAVGATNASWVWCPYMSSNVAKIAALYPGDEYVDWTCIDGYNHGTLGGGKWKSFAETFGPDYSAITGTIAPSKPMLLGEVASSESGGSKAAWIDEMFAQLPAAFPAVRGLLWFDYYDQGNDWPIETSTSATEAFAAGIGDPRYLGNSLAALPNDPVPLP